MVTLVVGTNNSGKSGLAESIVLETAVDGEKYYIATMIPYGDEGIKRVEKHRKMREGKGFVTLEWPADIDNHLDQLMSVSEDIEGKMVEAGENRWTKATFLLECMSNLVGNEMYADGNVEVSDDALVSKITDEVGALISVAGNVVIVTNVFPTEAEGYDAETVRYVKLTRAVNDELKKMSDVIYELKDGVWVKNENY